MKKPEHQLLLVWMMVIGVIAFGFTVAWDLGLIQLMVATDKSKICLVIGLLYIIGTLDCARQTIYLSQQLQIAQAIERLMDAYPGQPLQIVGSRVQVATEVFLPQGFMSHYLRDLLHITKALAKVHNPSPLRGEGEGGGEKNQGLSPHPLPLGEREFCKRSTVAGEPLQESIGHRGTLSELYSARIKGSHENGWFMVDAILKLGLLGTIIGFILMLGSVAETTNLELNTMQKVLKQMSIGMGTALYTTLAGLICSLLLALQYQLLERAADELIAKTVYLAEVQILPTLPKNG